MRYTISVITVIALLTATPALAADSPKEERVGVGTGAVIGAIAGGPLGFIVGAAIGAKIGDTMHKKNESIDTLSVTLEDSRNNITVLKSDVRALNTDIDSLGAELERIQEIARPELVSLLQAGIAMDLSFRTDEL